MLNAFLRLLSTRSRHKGYEFGRASTAQGKSVLLAAALLLLGQESVPPGLFFASVLNGCWEGHDHAGMSACIEQRAKAAGSSLAQAEKLASDAIRASKDELGFPSYRRDALAALERSSAAFAKYADDECGYEASLAVKDNGSEDVRLACQVVLKEERAERLKISKPLP